MLRWRCRFTVMGTFQFPVDMMRYDACYPVTEQDSARILATFPPQYTGQAGVLRVELERWGDTREEAGRVTPRRWKSFLWAVDLDSIQVERR